MQRVVLLVTVAVCIILLVLLCSWWSSPSGPPSMGTCERMVEEPDPHLSDQARHSLPNPERLLLVTASTARAHALLTADINKRYAQRHGYSFQYVDLSGEGKSFVYPDRDYQWCKIAVLRHYLPSYDYVMWIDDDAAVVGEEMQVNRLIYLAEDADIILTRDLEPVTAINSGVIIMKSSPFSLDVLERLHQGKGCEEVFRKGYHEQTCLEKLFLSAELANPYRQLHYGPLAKTLDEGYLVQTEHFCIFNEHVCNSKRSSFLRHLAGFKNEERERLFRSILNKEANPDLPEALPIFPWVGGGLRVAPRYLLGSRSQEERAIPYRLIQTFETMILPHSYYQCIRSWLETNPEYDYRYYTDRDCLHEIRMGVQEGLLPSDTVEAYQSLVPGAYRADLWRYCSLYLHGGVYADIKMMAKRKLDSFITANCKGVLVLDMMDRPKAALYNAFIAMPPRSPLMKKTIDACLDNIRKRSYSDDMLAITGPHLMGRAIYQELGYPAQGHRPSLGLQATAHGDLLFLDHVRPYSIVDGSGNVLVQTRSPDSNRENIMVVTGKPHYSELWSKRKVYRD